MDNQEFQKIKEEYLRRQSGGDENLGLILIIGIILIVVGYFINNENQGFFTQANTTTATLYYELNSLESTIKENYYNVYAKYTVDGREYYEALRAVKSSGGLSSLKIKDGKKETIYYNPNNPKEIRSKESSMVRSWHNNNRRLVSSSGIGKIYC